MTGPATATIRSFRPGDEAAIMDVVDAALPVDRIPGVTRQDMLRTVDRLAADPAGTLVALEGERIVGYCVPRLDDITVHPAFRRRGHGRRLIAAALELVASRGLDELELYGSPATAAGAGFIEALGATYHSSVWMFELVADVVVPGPSFPADVVTRPYRHPDDLAAYIALARASFADHPTPIEFSEAVVTHSHGLPEFDPAGILLVAPVGDPGTLVAWTRTRRYSTDAGEARGSIDFVGVVPAWRRRGLGRELLRWGIARLRAAGAGTIELHVTAANERALDLYRAAGFVAAVEWPHYALRVPGR